MRGQLDRVERLERVSGLAQFPFDAIHIHFYAPSEDGPLLVGARGPIVPGRGNNPDPINIDREPGESEAEFLARVDRVFGELQAAMPPMGNGVQRMRA